MVHTKTKIILCDELRSVITSVLWTQVATEKRGKERNEQGNNVLCRDDLMSCQHIIKNHLAFYQGSESAIGFRALHCLWKPPLPTCLCLTWGNLGLLEALTWRDPFVRNISPRSLTIQLPAISSHYRFTLVPGTGLGTQEPRISISIAPCLSLQPLRRSHASMSNCKTKGPQIFLFNIIHYFRGEISILNKNTFQFPMCFVICQSVVHFIQILFLYVHFNTDANHSFFFLVFLPRGKPWIDLLIVSLLAARLK